MFENTQLDASRTCIYWNDQIDLPGDTIYEYGEALSYQNKQYTPII